MGLGIGKKLKKAVGKVSKALGGNAYGSVFKAEAAQKEAEAKNKEAQQLAKREKEAQTLANEIKQKKSKRSENSLISQETIQGFLRSIIG